MFLKQRADMRSLGSAPRIETDGRFSNCDRTSCSCGPPPMNVKWMGAPAAFSR